MSDDRDEKLRRIVETRMKLRARFLAEMEKSPSLSDGQPQGSGPANRHGMPRLPPEQTETHKWPVLDLGIKPEIPTEKWALTVDGACRLPVVLSWSDFLALEQIDDISDFHCVTKWSRMDVAWRGVRMADVIALAEPRPEARYLLCHAYDGYTTNLPMSEALKPDVLLVHTADGKPLELDHGGPVRAITPQLYAWKGAKWIKRIELLTADRRGFWEERGYSSTAYPWRNDRYS
jgi:DMSO/TMAO reductase YedYZ molybdopterin-dependent catalytic subunit